MRGTDTRIYGITGTVAQTTSLQRTRSGSVLAAWFSWVTRASRWVWIAVSLALVNSSPSLAAPVWSAPDPIDPAIDATSVSCSSVSFCAAVGFTSAFGSAAVYTDGTWGEASLIDPGWQLFSVSCTSSSFCMAMDGSGGALTYNGSTWSAPTSTGTDLTRVSCASPSFCVAVGDSGEAAIYDGSMWSAPTRVDSEGGLKSVSCASESFCMAVSESNAEAAYALTYNGSTWSNPTEIDPEGNNGLQSVSCGSPSFCVALGNSGNEVTYSNGMWGKPTLVGHGSSFQSVSCHSESFCVAMSFGGETVSYNGITWSTTGAIRGEAARAVSCPAQSFCVGVGGYASTYSGSNWASPVPVGGGGLSSVSCSSPTRCVAVDLHGRVLSYNGSTWSAPSLIDPESSLDSVSCPSSVFCVAAGGRQHGYALTYNGRTWSGPSEIDSEGEMDSVSCVSASFCVAVTAHTVEGNEHGYALTYNGGAWSTPSEIDSEAALRSVSCASESFCVAVGSHDAVIYSGGSWSEPSPIDAEGNLQGVSCPSSSFCVATVERNFLGWITGEALTYNGSAWSAPSEIPPAPERGPFDVGAVSCASSSFCVAAASIEGAAAIFASGAWSAWTSLEFYGGFSSVSCPVVSSCVAVNGAGQAFTYGNPPTEPPRSGGAGATASSDVPPTGPPIGKRKPLVNAKTGEITLEYNFPEPGEAETYGEVIDGATLSRFQASSMLGPGEPLVALGARRGQAKKCKKGYLRSGKRCVKNTPVRYGRARLAIAVAGTYKLHVKPSDKVLTALRKNKTLTVRLTLVFTPAGTTDHIHTTATVRVHLGRRTKASVRCGAPCPNSGKAKK
jgi:hypothetical protein